MPPRSTKHCLVKKAYFAKYIREERSTTFKNCLKNFTFNKPTSHGDSEPTFYFKKIVKNTNEID